MNTLSPGVFPASFRQCVYLSQKLWQLREIHSDPPCFNLTLIKARTGPWGGHALTQGPITINRPANNDRTNECPDKCVDPPVSEQIASSDAEQGTNYSCD